MKKILSFAFRSTDYKNIYGIHHINCDTFEISRGNTLMGTNPDFSTLSDFEETRFKWTNTLIIEQEDIDAFLACIKESKFDGYLVLFHDAEKDEVVWTLEYNLPVLVKGELIFTPWKK
ncbi:MAG: hypothetical protein ACRC92_27200 [Peptostreptococcaceae bacterium]